MVEYYLYMELPFNHISIESELYKEDNRYIDPDGNFKGFFEKRIIVNPDFNNYFHNSFKKLIPKIEMKEMFTLKLDDPLLFFLILKIKIIESYPKVEIQLRKLLKWFPIIVDFFPKVQRMERITTNIPINNLINNRIKEHFLLMYISYARKKKTFLGLENYNFHSFISEYSRFTYFNILKMLYKNLQDYYEELFGDFNISIKPYNFYGKIIAQENLENSLLIEKLLVDYDSYMISLYTYTGEDIGDFLREVESFRYRMNPLEFKKLIQYERYFEDIYQNFFSNEVPNWYNASFENVVFNNYQDKGFYINQPMMMFRLPDFPKNYIKLRTRIQEVLSNAKNLLLSKSSLIKMFKKEELRDKLESIEFERDFREEILIPILKDLGFDNIQDTHGQHEYGVDILFSNINKFGLMEWNGIVAKIRNINLDEGTKISQNLKKIITQIYQAKSMYHLEKNYGDVKLTRVFVATNSKINYYARNILSQKDPLIEGNIFFIDNDTFLSLF